MNYIGHAYISSKFYKALQISVRPKMYYIYFLNSVGSRISNVTFPCVMKVMRISLPAYLNFSAFLYISEYFSTFLCISQRVSIAL